MNIIYHPTYKSGSTNKWLCIHHSGGLGVDNFASTQYLTAENVNQAHKKRWNFKSEIGWYGGYNFFINSNGKITQFRAIGEETMAQKGFNQNGEVISICLVGNFQKHPLTGEMVDKPTQEQENALRGLYGAITRQIGAVKPYNIVPHRFFSNSSTDCFGTGLPDNWARNTILDRNTQLNFIQQMLVELMDILRTLKLKKLGGSSTPCDKSDLRN